MSPNFASVTQNDGQSIEKVNIYIYIYPCLVPAAKPVSLALGKRIRATEKLLIQSAKRSASAAEENGKWHRGRISVEKTSRFY